MARISPSEMLFRSEYCNRSPMVYDLRQFVQSGYTYTDFRTLSKNLQSLVNDYPNIAFYLIYSTTKKDKDCKRVIVRDGHAGRPRHEIHGNKTLPHVHCLYLDLSPDTTIQKAELEIIDHLRELHADNSTIKRYAAHKFEKNKIPSLHAGNYFRYMYEQADNECFGGAKHDWNYYKSDLWHN